jgi:hypothetical protein
VHRSVDDQLIEDGLGLIEPAEAQQGDGERAEGIGVAGLGLEDASVEVDLGVVKAEPLLGPCEADAGVAIVGVALQEPAVVLALCVVILPE